MVFKKQIKLLTLILLATFCLAAHIATAEMVITIRAPDTKADKRKNYPNAAVKLALDKTQAKYGSYTLKYTVQMNTQRLLAAARSNVLPNLLIQSVYDDAILAKDGLTFIDIPFDLGITSYRICFINPAIQDELKKIKSVEDLKRFSIVQGMGWPDTKILRHNGFKVIESNSYDGLFKMIPARRADLFCRGINELKNEYSDYKDLGGLSYDKSFALFYPLPRYFYLNENNHELKARIEEGIKIAYADGSLKRLLFEFYADDIEFSTIPQRNLFQLENPSLKGLDPKYKDYLLKQKDL
jgi:hypothetical protein